MQDVWMWSNDPKDPKWRIRILEQAKEVGLIDMIEEATTSTGPKARPAEVLSRIVLTSGDFWRLFVMMGRVLAKTPFGEADRLLYERRGEIDVCRVCGLTREETAAFTARHHERCAAAVAFGKMLSAIRAMGELPDEKQ